jgi:ABC-2 type transport system permease protein
MNRILAVAWKELMHLRRDRLSLALIVLLPTVQFLLFGFAIDTDVRHVPLAVLDRDASPDSRALVRRLEATKRYDRIGHVQTYDEAHRALRTGRCGAVLAIPAGFAADAAAGRPRTVQLLVDGSDPMTVSASTGAASGLAAAAGASALRVEIDLRYNPEQVSAVYIVPGLVGVILTFTLVLMTALAIAREREQGTIEGLVVSPVRPVELIVGKLAPYIIIGYVQMTLVLGLGAVLFGIHAVPAMPTLYLIALLFIGANLSVGLLFSTVARTQGQAMQMAFFFLLPNILISGFMFPIAAMPKPIQLLTEVLPLTHFLRVLRGTILKGAGLGDVAWDVAWLGALFIALAAFATLRVRRRLA